MTCPSLLSFDILTRFYLFPRSGAELGAGGVSRPQQEDGQRPAARRERAGRPRQVQDAQADPHGQHQAEDRRIWGLVTPKPTQALKRPYCTVHTLVSVRACVCLETKSKSYFIFITVLRWPHSLIFESPHISIKSYSNLFCRCFCYQSTNMKR